MGYSTHIIFLIILFQLLSIAHRVHSEDISDDHRTPLGNRVPKQLLRKKLLGIMEKEWNNHLYEVQNLPQGIKMVGPHGTSHDFSKSKMTIHEPCVQENENFSKPIMLMIDGEQLEDCTFKYYSYTLENRTRIITDVNGTVITGLLDGKQLYALGKQQNTIFTVRRNLEVPFLHTEREIDHISPKALRTGCRGDDTPIVMELAITFDSTLCEYFNKDQMFTFAAVYDIMYMAMLAFHYNTCIRHKVVYVSGFCNRSKDIYRKAVQSQKASDFLDALRKAWYSNVNAFNNVRRGLVYLLIGRGLEKTRGSIRGGICSKKDGYAWSGYQYGSSIISRELGHSLSARYHNEFGYMYKDWKTSKELHNVKLFHEKSLKDIRKVLRSKGSCLLNGPAPQRHRVIKNQQDTCERWFRDNASRSHWEVPKERGWIDLGSRQTYVHNNDFVFLYCRLFQSRTHFIMELRVGSPGIVIESYRRRPRIYRKGAATPYMEFGPEIKVFRNTLFSFGATRFIRSEWTWAELYMPSDVHTCCGHSLFIDFELRLCTVPQRICEKRFVQFALRNLECEATEEKEKPGPKPY